MEQVSPSKQEHEDSRLLHADGAFTPGGRSLNLEPVFHAGRALNSSGRNRTPTRFPFSVTCASPPAHCHRER